MRNPILVALVTGLMAMQVQAGERDLERLQDEAVERLQAYVRIDTVNPPGNESRGVEYLAQLLASAGIKYETAESAPGRGNLWARLEGGPGKALVLLHHIDVVPADPRFWTTAPLGGEIRDGYLYGRGTLDTKGLGIFGLQAFLELHRAGKPLSRPVIFVATADEEGGGEFGAGWLVKNRPEIFADAGVLLNEGGFGIESGGRQMIGVEVAQKVPLWLRLTVTDRPGHGSAPWPQSSVTRLVRALDIVGGNPFEPRVIPAVDKYAKARAAAGVGPQSERAANLGAAIADAAFLKQVREEDPAFAALLQDTCAVTRLHGSDKINTIPPEAWAEIDCRLLPDQDPEAFIALLHKLIGDDGVEIKTLMGWGPTASSVESPLFAAIEAVAAKHHPGAAVSPAVLTAFTDSHFFRERGIAAYGYAPVMLPVEEAMRVHGNDERLSIENIRRGTMMMLELVERLVYAPE
jgi:acetylornithine deacetylase/succinyl-diaminopimelate desuccinylase-like protein